MQKIIKNLKGFRILYVMLVFSAIILCSIASSCTSVNKSSNQNIQDIRGKNVSLSLPINKVVSAHNPTLNHLVILGNGTSKYIIGFGRKDIASNLYSKILSDWDSLEIIGNDSTPVNKETILNLNPDLIILPEYNWETKEKDYEGTNTPTFVCFPKTESIESVTATLEMLAKLFSEEKRAQQIKDSFNKIIYESKESIKDIEIKPKAAFLGPQIYSLATNNMLQNQIIETAGGTSCVPDNLGDHFATIEPEVLININPEYIFIPSYAQYTVDDIVNDQKLSNISAVKNKLVFKFPSNLEPWDMPTCSSALGVAWLTNKLHPQNYSMDKLTKNAVEFYQLLYNHKFDENEFGID